MMENRRLVVYVDIDDTLVRSYGTTRIPIVEAVRHVRELWTDGAELYAWSSGGSDYARSAATELGIAECFAAFLPKPDIVIDDQRVGDWRGLLQVHPREAVGKGIDEYLGLLGWMRPE
jgi:hypothetical protein